MTWFWAHRRNASLLHMSIFVRGLHGKGFLPEVNFYFLNQAYRGVPGKGVYIYYDKEELEGKYADIHADIENNPEFPQAFKEKQDQIFNALFAVCDDIDATDLEKTGSKELHDLLAAFTKAATAGPLITVQLWGIEACWDERYALAQELKEKAPDRFDDLKGQLSQSTGESIAYSERKSMLQALAAIQAEPSLAASFTEEKLDDYPDVKKIVLKHIKDFEWVNSEYVSEQKTVKEWLALFAAELDCDARAELKKLEQGYHDAIAQRQALIDTLGFSDTAQAILAGLNEFVAQRDFSKGQYCYALARLDKLLQPIAAQLKQSKEEILLYDVEELLNALKTEKALDVSQRLPGWLHVSKEGEFSLYESAAVETTMQQEGLEDMLDETVKVTEFKGVVANAGRAKGKARVIDEASKLDTFEDGEILVTYMTTMEFTPLFKKAAAIVTDEGGLSSHAAIISREFGLPCIVGTKVATRTLQDGDLIEVDADNGLVRVLERKTA